jgi:Tol biopolymer transport system component
MFWKKMIISLILVLALGLAAEVANADFTFGEPTNLGPTINSSGDDWSPSISADGLELYFGSAGNLWVATRETLQDPWGEPVNLGPTLNTSADEGSPSISGDGLELYFMSIRHGGSGSYDIFVATRATKDDPWGEPVNLGTTVNSSAADAGPVISTDGLSLFFSSNRPGSHGAHDIYVSTRATKDDPWGEPVNLGSTVNSSTWDYEPELSADSLSLLFGSFGTGRSERYGSEDIWLTRRETIDGPWGEPVNLGPEINRYGAGHPSIPADGSTVYFISRRSGGSGGVDIWQVSIEPVVDLNGDGIVDAADMCIIVDNWGTDEPLCDIGPMPWGDGIVDVQDLIVLAEHLFEEIPPVE